MIAEVQEIADKYSIGSGWVHGEEMADGSQGAKQELKELKALIRHMKRVYKKQALRIICWVCEYLSSDPLCMKFLIP